MEGALMNTQILNMFIDISKDVGVSVYTLLSICTVESSLNPLAVNLNDNKGGSYGICQLSLRTAKWLNPNVMVSDIFNPKTNIQLAAIYLKRKVDRHKDNELSISAYNTGSNTNIINTNYVNRVNVWYNKYKKKFCVIEQKKECLSGH